MSNNKCFHEIFRHLCKKGKWQGSDIPGDHQNQERFLLDLGLNRYQYDNHGFWVWCDGYCAGMDVAVVGGEYIPELGDCNKRTLLFDGSLTIFKCPECGSYFCRRCGGNIWFMSKTDDDLQNRYDDIKYFAAFEHSCYGCGHD